jgi:hypothetical protein
MSVPEAALRRGGLASVYAEFAAIPPSGLAGGDREPVCLETICKLLRTA